MSYLDPVINPTEDELNAWLSTQTLRGNTNSRRLSDLLNQEQLAAMQADNAMGGDPGVQFAAPQQMPQQQPLNTIRSSSGRTIDLGYAAPGGSGVAPDGRRVKSDPWVDGPRVLSRKQLADGTIEVIKEAPALDGFGRQSSKIVREIETPDYLNPAMLKKAQYEKAVGEARKANITPEEAAERVAMEEAAKARTPGTEAYNRIQAAEAAKQKAGQRLQGFNMKANIVRNNVDEALLDAGVLSTGFIGQMTRELGGTPAKDLAQTVATIKANIGFEELQKMRDASPTGGALGQVAIQELERLEATLGSLDTSQSEGKLRQNLKDVKSHYDNWLKIMRNANGGQQGDMQEQPQQPQQPRGALVPVSSEDQAMRLPPGTRFRLPDGRTGRVQ